MSRVSYFQRFSQQENHATNNTLLIFRYFYQSSPLKLQRVLTSLIESDLEIGLSFEQQIRGDKSVPDALISQEPLRIFIETKRGDSLNEQQIAAHIESIVARSQGQGENILLGLTKEPILPGRIAELRDQAALRGIHFAAVTFSQIVGALRSQCADYESDLLAILEDYELYLGDEKLLEERSKRIVVFPCGDSYVDNKRLALYYEPTSRPCKKNNFFLGIYTDKRIIYVGKIETIVKCNYQNGAVSSEVESGTFTQEQRERVISAIETIPYHKTLKTVPHRFYLVDEFADTDVQKITSGGLMGFRYFNLSEIAKGEFDPHANYTSTELATLLREKTIS